MHNAASSVVPELIDKVIAAERPDLVIITGDIIYSSPADETMKEIIACFDKHNVPFCTMFGNHDADFGASKAELYDIIRSFQNCIMPPRNGVESPDYTLEVMSTDGKSIAALLYCLDSNAHRFDENGKFIGYDWIHDEQVDRYCEVSASYTMSNGRKRIPALAFFHIPLPEYKYAVVDENAPMFGTRMEPVCSPEYNSGMFEAMNDHGDVFATFVGHDHDNDFVTMYNNIVLCYGRFSGGNTEYNNLPNGARVIMLKEGERKFETYIRLRSGEVIDHAIFPDYFIKTDWRTR